VPLGVYNALQPIIAGLDPAILFGWPGKGCLDQVRA